MPSPDLNLLYHPECPAGRGQRGACGETFAAKPICNEPVAYRLRRRWGSPAGEGWPGTRSDPRALELRRDIGRTDPRTCGAESGQRY